ncbi:MAG: hypothetical protein B6227_05670 [Fusobacteriia bacterium 4572_74]|nr:MAG: hypothetical protein B6227_05670 [Fusobacteriia bacterium 4572_74]
MVRYDSTIKKYYEEFIEPGNEFKNFSDYKDFSPLSQILELKEKLEIQEVFLSNDLKIKIDNFFESISMNCSMAMTLNINDGHEYVSENNIEEAATKAIQNINELLIYIKIKIYTKTCKL